MASLSISSIADVFPAGTSVGAYPASGWSQAALPPSDAPPVSATATGTVASGGSLAITGLADSTAYFLGASVSGTWRYRRASTPVAPAPTPVTTEADPVAEGDLATHAALTTGAHNLATLLRSDVVNVERDYGLSIDPAAGAANRVALQQAILDAQAGYVATGRRQTILLPGLYKISGATTVSGVPYLLYQNGDGVQLVGGGHATGLWSDEAAVLIFQMGYAKGDIPANFWSRRFVDATTYQLNTVTRWGRTVTTTTAADAGNFAAGDKVFAYSGFLTNNMRPDEVDGQINEVISVNAGTGVITLKRPMFKSLVQEYFPKADTTNRLTTTTNPGSTTLTANMLAGDTSVTVAAGSTFVVGQTVTIGEMPTMDQMVVGTIVSNTVTFSQSTYGAGGSGVRFAHSSGDRIGPKAPFGICKVTDRLVTGLAVRNMRLENLTDDANTVLLRRNQVEDCRYQDLLLRSGGYALGGGSYRKSRTIDNDIELLGSSTHNWFDSTATGCSEITIKGNEVDAPNGAQGFLHIHEGSAEVDAHDNRVRGTDGATSGRVMLSIRARAWGVRVRRNVFQGSDGSNVGFIDSTVIQAGNYVGDNDFVTLSALSYAIRSAASGATGPRGMDTNRTNGTAAAFSSWAAQSGDARLQTVSFTVLFGAFGSGSQSQSIQLPGEIVIDDIVVEVTTAFNNATTAVLQAGSGAGGATAYFSGIDLRSVSRVSRKEGTLTAGTEGKGYQANSRAMTYQLTGTGTTPTAGKALVTFSYYKVQTV